MFEKNTGPASSVASPCPSCNFRNPDKCQPSCNLKLLGGPGFLCVRQLISLHYRTTHSLFVALCNRESSFLLLVTWQNTELEREIMAIAGVHSRVLPRPLLSLFLTRGAVGFPFQRLWSALPVTGQRV